MPAPYREDRVLGLNPGRSRCEVTLPVQTGELRYN